MTPGAAGRAALRRALGVFPTGVCVVTCADGVGRRAGVTVSSFNSVSLDPPLVLWSLANSAPSLELFKGAQDVAINVLGAHQRQVSDQFARPATDKFSGVDWTEGLRGAPLIRGAVAWFECRRYAAYPGGDHTIFLCEVERFAAERAAPLVFHGGAYQNPEQAMLAELLPFGVPS